MNRSFQFVLIVTVSTFFFSCTKSDIALRQTQDTSTINKKWFVSTFAGSGVTGSRDGDSNSAQFDTPTGIAVDSRGNVFVSDLSNFNIRKISPDRRVTTYAGKSVYDPAGYNYGYSYDLAIDRSDHLYSIDSWIIRKIESPTVSSIFAGQYLYGNYKDGIGATALFNIIEHLAIDAHYNIYVPDYDLDYNFKIRKVTPAGFVTTLSIKDNTGFPTTGSQRGVYMPPITVDDLGNIYVAAYSNNIIKKITPDGVASVFAGEGDAGFTDGKGNSARFNSITGLAIDSYGNIWVADRDNNAIRRITPDGTVTTIAGGTEGYADGEGMQARFSYPFEIAVDKKGVVYVSEMGNNRIRKIEYK